MWLVPALLGVWARSGKCVYGCGSASGAEKVGINYFSIFGRFRIRLIEPHHPRTPAPPSFAVVEL